MKRLWPLMAVALLAGMIAAALQAAEVHQASVPAPPTVEVPAPWDEVRQGYLHALHLEQAQVTCDECHGDAGFASPPRSRCEHCHAPQARIEHGRQSDVLAGPSEAGECIGCHQFGSDPLPTRWRCMRCHAEPQGQLAATRIHAQQECRVCHTPHGDAMATGEACDGCHGRDGTNEDAPKVLTRAGGGDEGAGPAQSLGHAGCTTCHGAHSEAQLAQDSCMGCHDEQRESGSLAGQHAGCSACHTPHRFAQDQAVACQSCHGGMRALASERVAAHRRCESCHAPHGPPTTGADRACRACHAQIETDHPPTGRGRQCTGCHQAHPERQTQAHGAAVACTACHGDGSPAGMARAGAEHLTQVHGEPTAHGGQTACGDCHTPHRFAVTDSSQLCANCHAEQHRATTTAQVHDGCRGCHSEHVHDIGTAALSPGARVSAGERCRSCHGELTTDRGHERCGHCHDPHSAAVEPQACAGCHPSIARRARTGHAVCANCHAPHAGAPARTPPACTSCHNTQGQSPHSQRCTDCHDTHGGQVSGTRTWPNCRACHQEQLPGMHKLPGHDTCMACHKQAHAQRGPALRETCTACHTDQINHEPEAKSCQSCHLFK